MLNPYKKMI